MATKDLTKVKRHVLLCEGESCKKRGACDVTIALREEIARQGLDDVIHTTKTRCNGRCQEGPIVIVYPEGVWYQDISTETAVEIVTKHLASGLNLYENILHRFQADESSLEEHESNCTTSNPVRMKTN